MLIRTDDDSQGPQIGDPVRVCQVKLEGVIAHDEWIWATVCVPYNPRDGSIGVAFKDGSRQMCHSKQWKP